jgi:hypothetical protein
MDVECEILIQFIQASLVFAVCRQIIPKMLNDKPLQTSTIMINSVCFALAALVSSEITKFRKLKEK